MVWFSTQAAAQAYIDGMTADYAQQVLDAENEITYLTAIFQKACATYQAHVNQHGSRPKDPVLKVERKTLRQARTGVQKAITKAESRKKKATKSLAKFNGVAPVYGRIKKMWSAPATTSETARTETAAKTGSATTADTSKEKALRHIESKIRLYTKAANNAIAKIRETEAKQEEYAMRERAIFARLGIRDTINFQGTGNVSYTPSGKDMDRAIAWCWQRGLIPAADRNMLIGLQSSLRTLSYKLKLYKKNSTTYQNKLALWRGTVPMWDAATQLWIAKI